MCLSFYAEKTDPSELNKYIKVILRFWKESGWQPALEGAELCEDLKTVKEPDPDPNIFFFESAKVRCPERPATVG